MPVPTPELSVKSGIFALLCALRWLQLGGLWKEGLWCKRALFAVNPVTRAEKHGNAIAKIAGRVYACGLTRENILSIHYAYVWAKKADKQRGKRVVMENK